MAKREKADQKTQELKRTGTFNSHAAAVADPLFKENPFFDSRDLLQVRYEMLRRHSAEGLSILDAAQVFGVSRPTFYQSQASTKPGWPDSCRNSVAPRAATRFPTRSSTTFET